MYILTGHHNTLSSEKVHLYVSHIKIQPHVCLKLFCLVNGA